MYTFSRSLKQVYWICAYLKADVWIRNTILIVRYRGILNTSNAFLAKLHLWPAYWYCFIQWFCLCLLNKLWYLGMGKREIKKNTFWHLFKEWIIYRSQKSIYIQPYKELFLEEHHICQSCNKTTMFFLVFFSLLFSDDVF